MEKYIIKDLLSVARFIPYGLVVGVIVCIILSAINNGRVRRNKASFSVMAITGLITYLFIMLFITFWSRESGTNTGIDMELFSTWGINTRNNAYVIENILLFVPYGFLLAWAVPKARKLWTCTWIGAMTTVAIEYLQLFTGRGYFQIDDVLTNILGAFIGYLFFWCVMLLRRCFIRKG